MEESFTDEKVGISNGFDGGMIMTVEFDIDVGILNI